MKYFALCLGIVIFGNVSYAQDAKVVVLKRGDPAPFDGILLDANSQAKIISDKEAAVKSCELKLNYEVLKANTIKDLEIAKIKVDLDIMNKKYDMINQIKDAELKKANELAFSALSKNDRWIYWFGAGILAGIGTTVAITYAVNR